MEKAGISRETSSVMMLLIPAVIRTSSSKIHNSTKDCGNWDWIIITQFKAIITHICLYALVIHPFFVSGSTNDAEKRFQTVTKQTASTLFISFWENTWSFLLCSKPFSSFSEPSSFPVNTKTHVRARIMSWHDRLLFASRIVLRGRVHSGNLSCRWSESHGKPASSCLKGHGQTPSAENLFTTFLFFFVKCHIN